MLDAIAKKKGEVMEKQDEVDKAKSASLTMSFYLASRVAAVQSDGPNTARS